MQYQQHRRRQTRQVGMLKDIPYNPVSVPNVISSANAEEQAYLEKWKQLQRYVEPLKRMIKKWQREEGRWT